MLTSAPRSTTTIPPIPEPETQSKVLWKAVRPHLIGILKAFDRVFDTQQKTRCPQCGHIHKVEKES